MKKYIYEVDVKLTFYKTIKVEAVDDEQAEYFAHAAMRKENGLECDIDITRTFCIDVASDERDRYEV